MKKMIISAVTALIMTGSVNANIAETSTVNVAKRNGITQCLGQVRAVSKHVLGGKQHNSHGITKKKRPDEHMFLSMNVKGYPDGASHVVISSTPTKDGCDGFYVETSIIKKSCGVVEQDVFTGWTLSKELSGSGTTLLVSPTGSIHVYLTYQEGELCLVSRQEALYN